MTTTKYSFKELSIFPKAILCLLFILGYQSVSGQYSVSGPSTANVNEEKDYQISGSGPSYGNTVWYASGGTVVSSTLSTARIRWTQAGSRSVGVAIFYNPVDSSPEATPSKSVTVLSNDPPIPYNLTNNGPVQVCDDEGSVRLSDSQVGATYRLYRNNSLFGPSRSGTNNALTWTGITAGTYTVRATMNGQTTNMNGSVVIGSRTPTPITISVPTGDICSGNQIVLPSNGTGHSWTGVDGYITGNNPAFVILAPGESRTVTVTATDDCGNPNRTDSVTITASSAPSGAAITSGPTQLCQGSSPTDYNGSVTNATTFEWSISPAAAGTINGNGLVTWSGSYTGNATITLTGRNSCGQSSSANRQTTVSSAPVRYNLSAPAEVCSTGSVTLSDSQSGVNYQLFRNDVASGIAKPGTGSALVWTGASPGTYKIEATNNNGTCGSIAMGNEITIGSQTANAIEISVGVDDINNICSGQVVLSSNGTNHSWSGVDDYITGNNPAFVNLSPGESRTISVTATNDCGNQETDTVTITAQSAPSGAVINSGPDQICMGTPTSDYNGFASNASEYSWSISPTSAGSIDNDGTVTWSGSYSGTATITFIASSSCSLSDSATRQTVVSAPPSPNNLSAPSEVCTSGTVTLSDSQSGVNYQLFKDDVANGSAQSGTGSAITWSNVGPGTYKVVATNANGTCSGVDMNNEVTISSQTADPIEISVATGDINSICAGRVVLSVNGSNPNWTGIDDFITGDNPAYVDLVAGETRTISVSATNDCGVVGTDTITITALTPASDATITSGPAQICQGTATSTYTGTASDADTFEWTISPSNAGTINANGNVTWSGAFTGTATVTFSADNSCGSPDTDSIAVIVTDLITYYEDFDRDGYYVDTVQGCSNPDTARYVTIDLIDGPDDCDDDDRNINPATIWKLDTDGDEHAVEGASATGCEPPNLNYDDYTFANIPEDDCNDSDISVFEITTWYLDQDNDGYYISTMESCNSPGPGYRNDDAVQPNDCDDTDFSITNTRWYRDTDGDQLGDPDDETRDQCDEPTTGGPWVLNGNDPCPDDPDNLCDGGTPSTATGVNYVYSRSYQTERTSPTPFFTNNDEGLIQGISYFDGLGRTTQQIKLEQSPIIENIKKDIVTHKSYDEFGRMSQSWLPYADAQGAFGDLKVNPEQDILDYYNRDKYQNTTNPFSENDFENSPFNRVRAQAAPGTDWAMGSGHEIEFSYETNGVNSVLWFSVNLLNQDFESPSLVSNGYYSEGELDKKVTYDENHTSGSDHSTEEFKDKLGRMVLKRTYNDEIPHDTYYVYDDFGNLTYVLTPKMDGDPTNMDELGYQYIYDYRNRLVEKKIPGKGWEYIIYNRLDQPILTQDANQRLINGWLFTKFDSFGRVAYTGKATDNRNREAIQAEVTGLNERLWVNRTTTSNNFGSTVLFYTDQGYPTSTTTGTTLTEILTVNYYDNYSFDLAGGSTVISSFGVASRTNVSGLTTGTKVKVLDAAANAAQAWITTVTHYDEKGRPINNYSNNTYLGSVDKVQMQLDFVGRVLKSRTEHTRNGNAIVTIDNFTYDHAGRFLAQTQCIGDENLGDSCEGSGSGGVPNTLNLTGTIDTDQTARINIVHTNGVIVPQTDGDNSTVLDINPNATGGGSGEAELIVLNSYDELGRLDNKKVGGEADVNSVKNSAGLQTMDYHYNVRNWLLSINDSNKFDSDLSILNEDLFGFKLNFNDPTNNNTQALFNGNVSQVHWRSQNNDKSLRTYDYAYDDLNRITSATDNTNDSRYSLSDVTYDKNGNILTLSRKGHTSIDSGGLVTTYGDMDILSYSYNNGQMSNQLLSVTDSGNTTYGFKDVPGATDYAYDENGNLTQDLNKDIASDGVVYNHLDLPEQINISGGSISYVYDATGEKLKKTVSTGTVTVYAGNYIYENEKLQFITTSEGYVEPKNPDNLNAGFAYTYQYKDHLGNVRLSYSDINGDGQITHSDGNPLANEIVEENSYYPFGLKHKGYNYNAISSNIALKFKYNGKELQDELGLNMYSYGSRFYEPSLGRFVNIDPLAQDFTPQGPYVYGANNPVYFQEKDGENPIVGAFVSAALEIISQVGASMLVDNKTFSSAVNNINWKDVGWEAGSGALSGFIGDPGIGKFIKFIKKKRNRRLVNKVFSSILEYTITVATEIAKNVTNDKDIDLGETLVTELKNAGLSSLIPSTNFFQKYLKKNQKKLNKLNKSIKKLEKKKGKGGKKKRNRRKKKLKKKKSERNRRSATNDIVDGVNDLASGIEDSITKEVANAGVIQLEEVILFAKSRGLLKN